jgi:hypothetical protein
VGKRILAESKQEAIDLCVFFLCFISMLNYIYIYKQLLVFSKFLHGDVSVLIDECYVRNISSKGFSSILKNRNKMVFFDREVKSSFVLYI